jgi:hypothetical protein
VVTTLVVQASQSLQQDQQKVTAFLVQELIAVQRAAASNLPVIEVPPSTLNTTTTFIADGLSRWVNGLWFISLALSLSVALLSVLIKQWIQNYTVSSSGTLQDRVKLRHYRYLGIQTWYVPAIVHLLPILLHVSLLIFFAGLVVFLIPLNVALSWVVSAIGVVSYFVYFVTPWFPLWKPQCPYKSPLTQVAGEVSKLLSLGLTFMIERFADLCENVALQSESAVRVIQVVEETLHRFRRFILENPRISVKALEEMAIVKFGTDLTMQALESLHGSLSNPDLRTIALEAYAGLDIEINGALMERILKNQKLLADLQAAFLSCFHFENRREAHLLKGQEGKAERLARAFLRLQLGIPKTYDYRYASCWDYLHQQSEKPAAMPLALLAKSAGFLYQEEYSFLTQEVDDQAFIVICLRGRLKLSVWVWTQLEEQVIQRNLRDCFDDGDTVGLLQTMNDLITALPSDYENDQSRYTVLVLHSLGCDRTDCPEVHPVVSTHGFPVVW